MITLLAATLLTVKFPGGMPNEFVAALAEGVQQNVVLSQGEARLVPKAEFETGDLGEMSRAIRKQTLLSIMPGTDMVLSNQFLARRLVSGVMLRSGGGGGEGSFEISISRIRAEKANDFIPGEAMEGQPGPVLPVNFVTIPATAVKDGKVTFKTEKTDALQVQMLNGQFSKPVKNHWIYQEVPVYVQVKDMPELDFMKWVAKSIGAKLVSGAKEYSFELDPVEIRKRAVATISTDLRPAPSARKEDTDMAEKTRAFRIACLNALSPAQITEALASQGGNARIVMGPRSPLTNLAIGRIRELEQYQKNLTAESPAPRTAIGLMQRVDSSRSAYMVVDSSFTVRMEIPVLDQNGRPAGVVRL